MNINADAICKAIGYSCELLLRHVVLVDTRVTALGVVPLPYDKAAVSENADLESQFYNKIRAEDADMQVRITWFYRFMSQ